MFVLDIFSEMIGQSAKQWYLEGNWIHVQSDSELTRM